MIHAFLVTHLILSTSNGRGWGVRTVGFIRRGTFVMDYIGEVISNDEAERRGKVYDKIVGERIVRVHLCV